MTADVRDRLRKLTEAREKATPGPWIVWHAPDVTAVGAGHTMVSGVPSNPTAWVGAGHTDADAAAIVAEHNAVPWLVAALTAVLDLADELESYTIDRHPAPGSYDAGVIAMQVNAADRIRAVVAATGDQP